MVSPTAHASSRAARAVFFSATYSRGLHASSRAAHAVFGHATYGPGLPHELKGFNCPRRLLHRELEGCPECETVCIASSKAAGLTIGCSRPQPSPLACEPLAPCPLPPCFFLKFITRGGFNYK